MEAGALGCEVVIAGKLTGARARVQKFSDGYIKHCGEPSNTIVEKGYAVAVKKLGVIGVQVKIIPAGAKIPDHFEVTAKREKPRITSEITVTAVGEEVLDDIVEGGPDEFDEEEILGRK